MSGQVQTVIHGQTLPHPRGGKSCPVSEYPTGVGRYRRSRETENKARAEGLKGAESQNADCEKDFLTLSALSARGLLSEDRDVVDGLGEHGVPLREAVL